METSLVGNGDNKKVRQRSHGNCVDEEVIEENEQNFHFRKTIQHDKFMVTCVVRNKSFIYNFFLLLSIHLALFRLIFPTFFFSFSSLFSFNFHILYPVPVVAHSQFIFNAFSRFLSCCAVFALIWNPVCCDDEIIETFLHIKLVIKTKTVEQVEEEGRERKKKEKKRINFKQAKKNPLQ